jgi:hypothetical protein
VAGAQGALVAAILKADPQARGILFDLPNAVQGARALLDGEGVGARCDVAPGNFLEWTPRGGDVYIFKSVFSDCDDERASVILGNCHRAIRTRARLLIAGWASPAKRAPAPRFFAATEACGQPTRMGSFRVCSPPK